MGSREWGIRPHKRCKPTHSTCNFRAVKWAQPEAALGNQCVWRKAYQSLRQMVCGFGPWGLDGAGIRPQTAPNVWLAHTHRNQLLCSITRIPLVCYFLLCVCVELCYTGLLFSVFVLHAAFTSPVFLILTLECHKNFYLDGLYVACFCWTTTPSVFAHK